MPALLASLKLRRSGPARQASSEGMAALGNLKLSTSLLLIDVFIILSPLQGFVN